MRQERISLKSIELNKGQIDGLPANPRTWTREQLDTLKKSIEETPELLEARGLIVMPHGKKYIALGGNMRLCALKELGHTDAPCFVMDEDTSTDKMKEIVIKDNGAFGSHDYEALANEWDDLPLADWGVPAWDADVKADEPEAQEDDFDENTDAIEVVCKPGDIWQLGEHRLMCGDSIQLADVQKLMGGV